MPRENKLELRWLKSKNNKVKSTYLQLSDSNIGRSRALATFTVPAMTAKQLQLLLIKEIKNYFSKRLQNLKVDVQYFSVIELGQYKSNPHLHVQLFYDKEDFSKVEKAYQKTIENFSLVNKRCKLVKESEELLHSSSFNYIIKEFDNTKLSNKDILELDAARKKLKQGKTKHIQFHSQSRPQHSHPLYKALWFNHKLKYINVNNLMNGYATRLKGLKLLEARQTNKLPFLLFKNGAIQIKSIKLYELILFTLLYIGVFKSRSSEKCIYIITRKYNQDKSYIRYILSRKIINIKSFKYESKRFSFF